MCVNKSFLNTWSLDLRCALWIVLFLSSSCYSIENPSRIECVCVSLVVDSLLMLWLTGSVKRLIVAVSFRVCSRCHCSRLTIWHAVTISFNSLAVRMVQCFFIARHRYEPSFRMVGRSRDTFPQPMISCNRWCLDIAPVNTIIWIRLLQSANGVRRIVSFVSWSREM